MPKKFGTGKWGQALKATFFALLPGDRAQFTGRGKRGLGLINRCSRKPKDCSICTPQGMPSDYGMLDEEEEVAIELSERIKESMVMNFLLHSHEMDSSEQLLVTKDMDCRTVIRALGIPVKHLSSSTFSISEHWIEFGAERIIEENEMILDVHHRNMRSGHHFTFAYIRNIDKYPTLSRKSQYFIDPKGAQDDVARLPPKVDPNFILIDDPYFTQHCPTSARLVLPGVRDPPEKETDSAEEEEDAFFPYAVPVPSTSREADVSTPESDDRPPSRFYIEQSPEPSEADSEEELDDDLVNPTYCGTVFVKQGDQELTLNEVRKLPGERLLAKWGEKYMLLRNRKLYFVDTHENMVLCYIMKHDEFAGLLKENKKNDIKTLELIGPVSDFIVYNSSPKIRFHYNAPHIGGLYLRNVNGQHKNMIKMAFCPVIKPEPKFVQDQELMPGRRGREMWVTALSMAKHGHFVKQAYAMHLADAADFRAVDRAHENLDLQGVYLPMNFSKGHGEIILDEHFEALHTSSKSSERFPRYELCPPNALNHGKHLTQKYYHKKITRVEAETLIRAIGIDGTWLLRDSSTRNNPIISYLSRNRIYHRYISATTYIDSISDTKVYVATLDYILAFYDVHSLLDFYRINNTGALRCLLRQSVKNLDQPDDSPVKSVIPSNFRVLDDEERRFLQSKEAEDRFDKRTSQRIFTRSPQKPQTESAIINAPPSDDASL
ncbi:uncharacterized protein [Euwallacea fornicatus]|uniref:uncharacterized protein isoform X2 n=1 Tax=Euwallacea fornicatus TaxID=995702 RepID=UPI00338EFC78